MIVTKEEAKKLQCCQHVHENVASQMDAWLGKLTIKSKPSNSVSHPLLQTAIDSLKDDEETQAPSPNNV